MCVGVTRDTTLKCCALAALTQATFLALAAISRVLPAAYHRLSGPVSRRREIDLIFEFAIVLLITYGLNLVFTLHTHDQLLGSVSRPEPDDSHGEQGWSFGKALTLLLVSAVFIGWMGEVLVGSVEQAATNLGLTKLF